MKTMIQAHRGASAYCPENTLEAFALARDQGADGIELDVHLSKDGSIVVAHDERLERVSDGTGYINDYTLEELKSFDFGKLFTGQSGGSRKEPAHPIPALSEVFDLLKPSSLMINIELKTNVRLYPELPGKLVSLVRDYAMGERVLYSSFNHYSLLAVKERERSSKIGLLYHLGMVDPWLYAKHVRADAIHPHYSVIAALPETVSRCHENGIAVNVWTVDDPAAIDLMIACGTDAIISNKPDIAVKRRDSSTPAAALGR